MPNSLHQGILALFRADPWLAFDLLGIARPVDGTPIDRQADVEINGDRPLQLRVTMPDLVLVHRDPGDSTRGIVIAVEAQNDYDGLKRWRIPVYQAVLADVHRLPTWVVVVSLSPAMSAALKRWAVGGPPRVDVLLVDAAAVAGVAAKWLDPASERMEAVALVAALLGHAGDHDAAYRGLQLLRKLPEEPRRRYSTVILAALPKEQRDMWKAILFTENGDKLRDVERNSVLFHDGLEEGREAGIAEGRAEARATLAELILALLTARHVPIDAVSRQQVLECPDFSQLEVWAKRAPTIANASELFEP